MTNVEEPTILVPPCKKRSWSATLHGDGDDDVPAKGDVRGASDGALDMRGILARYHALAAAHHSQAKRRRRESAARAAQQHSRLAQLTALHRMARDTLETCERLLRSEESARRAHEREGREAEGALRRAEREKALAEDFLWRFGGDGGGTEPHPREPLLPPPLAMEQAGGGVEGQPPVHSNGARGMIGGIPAEFLDLSHFPQLRKSFPAGPGAPRNAFSPEPVAAVDAKRPLIDCTEGIGGDADTGVPREVALGPPRPSKRHTRRAYVSGALLAHANGTYVQEGRHRGAPLFVRAGPPRQFMGKDCRVVLRREGDEAPPGQAGGVQWKIGLVPAQRVAHPRLIGYYMAVEVPGAGGAAPPVDRMEEDNVDDEEEGGGVGWEPPAEGWRVCQEGVDGKGSNAVVGRASGLRVSYEE